MSFSILFGGRIAEEVFIHQMSTGASNGLERATKMARASGDQIRFDKLGVMVYEEDAQQSFMGSIGSRTIS